MEYTKELPNELVNNGFKLIEEYSDEDINYDVYKNHVLDITLDHTNENVIIQLDVENDDIEGVESLEDLFQLSKLISGK